MWNVGPSLRSYTWWLLGCCLPQKQAQVPTPYRVAWPFNRQENQVLEKGWVNWSQKANRVRTKTYLPERLFAGLSTMTSVSTRSLTQDSHRDIPVSLLIWDITAKSEPIQTINSGERKSTFLLGAPSRSYPQPSERRGFSPSGHTETHLRGTSLEKCFIQQRSKSGALKHIKMLQKFMAPYWGLVRLG